MLLRPLCVFGGSNNTLRPVTVIIRCTSRLVEAGDSVQRSTSKEGALPYDDIPGPKPIPVLGNTWRFFPGIGDFNKVKPKDFPRELHKRYGPIVKLSGLPGKKDFVFISDHDCIETVFRQEGPYPARGGVIESLDYFFREHRSGIAVGLATAQGKEWQEFRSAVNPIMMQPRNVKMYTTPLDMVSRDFIDRMREIRNGKGEMPDNFENYITKWALESMAYVALDTRLGSFRRDLPANSEPQQLIQAVEDAFHCMYQLDFRPSLWKFISTPTFRKFVRSMEYFQQIATKYVSQAMERLKTLPDSKRENHEYSVLENLVTKVDPSRAVAMTLDMILGGVDTTSMQTAVVLYQLASNPEKQTQLQKELDAVIPDPSKPITSTQLEQMKYLRACIKESARREPLMPSVARSTGRDSVLLGYHVPKGTQVGCTYSVLTSDDTYFPRAEEFLPERWLPGGERLKGRHPFALLPFGFGPRMCVGRRFADLQMEIFLAKLFRSHTLQWHLPPPETELRLFLTYTSPLRFTMVDRA